MNDLEKVEYGKPVINEFSSASAIVLYKAAGNRKVYKNVTGVRYDTGTITFTNQCGERITSNMQYEIIWNERPQKT